MTTENTPTTPVLAAIELTESGKAKVAARNAKKAATKKPAARKPAAKKATPAKKATTPATTSGSKRVQYPTEITEAVRAAKVARGQSTQAPGAKQHVMVRSAIGEQASSADILKATGVKTEKLLRAIADGSAPREELVALRDFGRQFADPFCRGRNLASIVVAFLDQAKARKRG